ncbi:anti-sigma factor antagonist [Alteromonas sediminis]|uniref:Anti-sigma factor antagonist n=1 Tax=Alteromonas sediminis TaxID=2259342 RepID=A0A3N5Y2Z7_9ALTE|nr:STAS domain-containing protein [Alteromonas sediminis]RPJ68337.1 anti-sigma factor antagonist [Alteromonas sediminis]
MGNTHDQDANKLGHDPLEWLGEEEADTETKPSVSLEASPQSSEPVLKPESDAPISEPEILEGPLTVAQVEEVHATLTTLIDGLPEGGNWTLDLSGVTQLDSSGYQLLVSAFNSCKLKQIAVSVTGLSESISELLTMLGDSTLKAMADKG